MNNWLTDNFHWAVVVMATIGGIVAHIRAYEKSGIELTPKQHALGLLRRFLYAAFSGLMVYFVSVEYHWSQPITCVTAGVVGMFGAEAIEFFYETAKDAIRTWANKKAGS